MSELYSYMDGVAFRHEQLKACDICGSEKVSTSWFRQDKTETVDGIEIICTPFLVGICSKCYEQARNAVFEKNGTQAFYNIESGWESNPIWSCKMRKVDGREVEHLHTTPAAGAAPAIFSGKVSGFEFQARQAWWPIESREGNITLVEWKNDFRAEREIDAVQVARYIA